MKTWHAESANRGRELDAEENKRDENGRIRVNIGGKI